LNREQLGNWAAISDTFAHIGSADMKAIGTALILLSVSGCVTFATDTSRTVTEYESVDLMAAVATCTSVGPVSASYDVFMHSPWGRKRAAHIHLKDAAHDRHADAVIMTSNSWGVVTDEVQGVAYHCTYGKPAEASAPRAPQRADPPPVASAAAK
jgi:hypothetical protein